MENIEEQEIVKKSFEIANDSELKKYAVYKSLLSIIFVLIGFFCIFLIIISIFAFIDSGFLNTVLEEYQWMSMPILITSFIIGLSVLILVIIIQIYIRLLFNYAALYYCEDLLKGYKGHFPDAIRKAKPNIWRLLKNGFFSKFFVLKLSFKQIKESFKWKKDEKIVLYDSSFVVPLIAFENLSMEDAVMKSSKMYTKDFLKIVKKQILFPFIFVPLIFIGSFVFLSIVIYFRNMLGLLIGVILTSIVNLFIGRRYYFLNQIFLVVMYNHFKDSIAKHKHS